MAIANDSENKSENEAEVNKQTRRWRETTFFSYHAKESINGAWFEHFDIGHFGVARELFRLFVEASSAFKQYISCGNFTLAAQSTPKTGSHPMTGRTRYEQVVGNFQDSACCLTNTLGMDGNFDKRECNNALSVVQLLGSSILFFVKEQNTGKSELASGRTHSKVRENFGGQHRTFCEGVKDDSWQHLLINLQALAFIVAKDWRCFCVYVRMVREKIHH